MDKLKTVYKHIINFKLLNYTSKELVKLLKVRNPEVFKLIKEEQVKLKREYETVYKFLKHIYNAYSCERLDSYERCQQFIAKNIIDKDGEVSPSQIGVLVKFNPEIKENILFFTENYPIEMSLVGRCELIRKNIKGFPVCSTCKVKQVSWQGSSSLSNYCSLRCADINPIKIEKQRQTYLKKHGNQNIEGRREIKAKIEETCLKRFGSKHIWSSKQGKEKSCKTRKRKYGTEYYVGVINKSPELLVKQKQTMLKKYGVKCYFELPQFVSERETNWFKKYGVKNTSQLEEVKNKAKLTCLEKYGVESYSQTEEFMHKKQTSSFKIKKYKDTKLYYQGSYEKYFLEKLEEKNLLQFVRNYKKGIRYQFQGKEKVYFSDFLFKDILVEIKSDWTYNKSGTDLVLQEKNEAKWKAAKEVNRNFVVLREKKEINLFIESLND